MSTGEYMNRANKGFQRSSVGSVPWLEHGHTIDLDMSGAQLDAQRTISGTTVPTRKIDEKQDRNCPPAMAWKREHRKNTAYVKTIVQAEKRKKFRQSVYEQYRELNGNEYLDLQSYCTIYPRETRFSVLLSITLNIVNIVTIEVLVCHAWDSQIIHKIFT